MDGFLQLRRAFAAVTAFTLGAFAAPACGGQSLVHSDGDSGGSSDGGTGQSGYSGTYDGGTSGVGGTSGGYAGTIDYGGTSYGGAPTGGIAGTIEIGGTSYGGAPTGGVAGTSGSAGFAGNGGICSLPFDPGPCRGYATMYGFSEPDGNCQPFVYGGCEGNENRFSTLAECEAKCGGSLNRCGEHTPWGQACMTEGQSCTYDVQDCLCAPKGLTDCVKLDPTCSLPDAGVSAIVIVAYTRCTCANGTWNCQPVTYGGGPL